MLLSGYCWRFFWQCCPKTGHRITASCIPHVLSTLSHAPYASFAEIRGDQGTYGISRAFPLRMVAATSATLAGSLALTGCGANLQNAAADGPIVFHKNHRRCCPRCRIPHSKRHRTVDANTDRQPWQLRQLCRTLASTATDAHGNFTFNQTYTCSSSKEYALHHGDRRT